MSCATMIRKNEQGQVRASNNNVDEPTKGEREENAKNQETSNPETKGSKWSNYRDQH
jgi:hypothetical protein